MWEVLHTFAFVGDFEREKLQLGAKFSLEVNGKSPVCDWWLICVFIFSSLAVKFCIYAYFCFNSYFMFLLHMYKCEDALAWFCRNWV